MNNTCGTCGGFVGNFMYAGDGARICNCANSDILKGERRRVIEQIRQEEREHTKQLILIKFLPHITDHQREMLVEILKEV